MNIKDIKIGQRIRKKSGNIQFLADSINEVGLIHAIVVNENNELIAGKRRLEAFELLERKEIPVTVVNLKNIVNGRLKAEFQENAAVKSLTPLEKVAVKKAIYPEKRKEAKERQAIAGPKEGKGKKKSGEGEIPEAVQEKGQQTK